MAWGLRVKGSTIVFGLGAALLLGAPAAGAQGVTSVAVVPYLSLGISNEDATAITEVIGREVAARTGAKVLAGAQIQSKLPPLPDGCPADDACVQKIAAGLNVERLLFTTYLQDEKKIDVSLSYTGGRDAWRSEFSLALDPTSWNDNVRENLESVLPDTRKGGKPIYKRWWVWGGAGGLLAFGVSFFLLQPTLR